MKEESVTDASLREFLLGTVDDEERERIESLFITDALSRERVITAEEELLEDYLEDSLTEADKERFLSQYARSPGQQRRLEISESIRNWAVAEEKRRIPPQSPASTWGRLVALLRLRPMFVTSIAATAIIAIVVVAVWLNHNRELRNQQLNLEQEIAVVNKNQAPAQMSLRLRPGQLRSADSQRHLVLRPDIQVVELRLIWNQDERYPTYRAVLRRVGDAQSLTIPVLQAESDMKAIRIKIPAHILKRGLYQLELSGIAADGSTSPMQEYQFEVVS